jgi:hypothetical protein
MKAVITGRMSATASIPDAVNISAGIPGGSGPAEPWALAWRT